MILPLMAEAWADRARTGEWPARGLQCPQAMASEDRATTTKRADRLMRLVWFAAGQILRPRELPAMPMGPVMTGPLKIALGLAEQRLEARSAAIRALLPLERPPADDTEDYGFVHGGLSYAANTAQWHATLHEPEGLLRWSRGLSPMVWAAVPCIGMACVAEMRLNGTQFPREMEARLKAFEAACRADFPDSFG